MEYDVLVIGGGAAGLVAALECARAGLRVCVAESTARVGRKIIASGNGRCNLSRKDVAPSFYNSPFPSKILAEFDCAAVVGYFSSLGLLTKTDGEGRVYPASGSSATVLNTLLLRLERAGAEIRCDTPVLGLKKEACFRARTPQGELRARFLVFAAGSGAYHGRESYELLEPFGHRVTPIFPVMTALRCAEITGADGVRSSARAALFVDGKRIAAENGEVLFKNGALSGILAFFLSSYAAWAYRRDPQTKIEVALDLVPAAAEAEIAAAILAADNAASPYIGVLHKALAALVLRKVPLDRSLLMTEEKALRLARACKNYRVRVDGLGAMNEAQAVCGGLDTADFHDTDLQSKRADGLYACGEALDVDGLCGGCNLHWAWASALRCGRSIAARRGEAR